MSEEILINVTALESRVALISGGVLQQVWQEHTGSHGFVGRIYKGVVSRVLPGLQAAFVDIGLERTAFLHVSDMIRTVASPDNEELETPEITKHLHENQHLIVQVIKDPLGSKGARLTSNITIPSRFLVLIPDGRTIGVSTRIEDEEERARLHQLVLSLSNGTTGHGYIVRTNAEGASELELATDMDYLATVWNSIGERQAVAEVASCIYTELSLPLRVLRDTMRENIERVRIDSAEIVQETLHFTRRFMPQWTHRIEPYLEQRPIFDLYGIEDEIEAALQREVPLKSGGVLVFDQTEAMTTIDVNSGSYTGKRNLEETIFKINLEATHTIARQLRLRNLGGIIIIDFIDMHDEENRRQLMRALHRELEHDMVKTRVSELSMLGLVEMTRMRTSESLEHRLCITCPNCVGRGTIKSTATVYSEIMRAIIRSGRQNQAQKLMVMAAPHVVAHFIGDPCVSVAELEGITGKSICFQTEEHYTQEQFDVVLL